MKKSVLIILLIPYCLCAQSVYLSSTHKVYKFLDRMEAMQIITDYRDAVKPMTRKDIARFLIQIDTTSKELTEIDQEQVFFFKEEFFQELQNLKYENVIEERWHLYQYQSDPTNLNIDLVGGYTYDKRADGQNTKVRSNGFSMYGYVGENIGGYFYFRDNHESGSFLDPKRILSPIPAEVVSKDLRPLNFDFDNIDAQLNIDLGFVTLSIEKMANVWGEAERGNVILSNKAPSYPQIKLRARLGDNLNFTYIHAWLYSDIIDSLRSYQVPDIPGSTGFRRINKQKYLAAHILEFTPWSGVDIALGESEVYGNRAPELIYMIPIMFFKGAEHWMYDTDNSQFFGNLDLNVIPNYNIYLSMFIDEFSIGDFLNPDKQRNQLGFTTGFKAYDNVVDNSKFVLEYTRLNPWIYNHKYPEVTFQSHSVDMGHWLGQNADLLFTQFLYQPMRSLEVGVQFESWRKGGMKPTIFQYRLPSPTFLYGPITKMQSFGIVGNYEIVRDLETEFYFLQCRYTSEVNLGIADYSRKIDAFIGIRYNFN